MKQPLKDYHATGGIKILLFVSFLLFCLVNVTWARPTKLDRLYGIPTLPRHIKYYEVDDQDRVMLNPYLQVASRRHKAVLNPRIPVYDWVIDIHGKLRIIAVVPHPRGRTYSGRYTRPEDGYTCGPGYVERYGHVSALAGAPGRIGGEIVNDYKNKRWVINNKSGRYSKENIDRFPNQLGNAAALIHAVVDPGGQAWGAVVYLLNYAPESVKTREQYNIELRFGNPKTRGRPYLLLDQDW